MKLQEIGKEVEKGRESKEKEDEGVKDAKIGKKERGGGRKETEYEVDADCKGIELGESGKGKEDKIVVNVRKTGCEGKEIL